MPTTFSPSRVAQYARLRVVQYGRLQVVQYARLHVAQYAPALDKSWARMIQQVYETGPLLCECGSKFEVILVIEARNKSDVAGKILACIKFVFEVLRLPERPPPAFSAPAARRSGRWLQLRCLLLLVSPEQSRSRKPLPDKPSSRHGSRLNSQNALF